jgi:MFS family permease
LTDIAPGDERDESADSKTMSGRPRSLVEIPYRQKLFLITALSVTLIVSSASQTVVATAAQNIVADIGGFELFTWMFAGFSLASAVAVPIVGKLADMYGTRPIILASLAIFVISSTAGGFVTSMEQMIISRAFQGLGFAGVLGSVWITTATMWAPSDRAKWLGALSGAFTLAGVLGPILGGVVSDEIGWRWLFWYNLPLGGFSLWLLLRLVSVCRSGTCPVCQGRVQGQRSRHSTQPVSSSRLFRCDDRLDDCDYQLRSIDRLHPSTGDRRNG